MTLAAGSDGVTMSAQTGRKSVSGYWRKTAKAILTLRKVISSHLLPPPKQAHNRDCPVGLN